MSAVERQLDQWALRPDGNPKHGSGSIVLPVLTAEGARAVLKIGRPDAESDHEHLVLRRWSGNGAVRLLHPPGKRRARAVSKREPTQSQLL